MNKAFTKENDDVPEAEVGTSEPSLPTVAKNYISPEGYHTLRQELLDLMDKKRPKVVESVHWAAKNGDRSENGDYLYGKKRLREIDRRIRFLTKRLEIAHIVDASIHFGREQVFFGATVDFAYDDGRQDRVTILGVDEAQSELQQVSWVAPIAKTLLKSHIGDCLHLHTPNGIQSIEVLDVQYPKPKQA